MENMNENKYTAPAAEALGKLVPGEVPAQQPEENPAQNSAPAYNPGVPDPGTYANPNGVPNSNAFQNPGPTCYPNPSGNSAPYGQPGVTNANGVGFVPGYGYVQLLSPLELEKKEFRRRLTIGGLSLVAILVVQLLVGLIISLVAVVVSMMGDGGNPLESTGFLLVYTGVCYLISFVLGAFMLSRLLKIRLPMKLFAFPKEKPVRSTLGTVCLGLGAGGLGTLIAVGIEMLTDSLFGASSVVSMPELTLDSPMKILAAILVEAVFPAFLEELVFRGYLLQGFRRYGDLYAVILTAAGFSLLHGNLQQIPLAFAVGLVLGTCALKTGSILPGMLMHLVNNTVAVLLDPLCAGMNEQQIAIANYGTVGLYILLGIAGFLLLLGIWGKPALAGKDNGFRKGAATFGSVGVWIFLVFSLIVIAFSFAAI